MVLFLTDKLVYFKKKKGTPAQLFLVCCRNGLFAPKSSLKKEKSIVCNSTSKVAHKYSYRTYLHVTDIDDYFQLKASKDSMKKLE